VKHPEAQQVDGDDEDEIEEQLERSGGAVSLVRGAPSSAHEVALRRWLRRAWRVTIQTSVPQDTIRYAGDEPPYRQSFPLIGRTQWIRIEESPNRLVAGRGDRKTLRRVRMGAAR